MSIVDRNTLLILLVFYELTSILTVYNAKAWTDIPAHVDGAHIVHEPNRASATGNKVGAVRIAHPGQLHPRPFGVLLTDTL